MRHHSLPATKESLFARQFGVATRDQLRNYMTDDQIRRARERGNIIRLYPGVFADASAAPSWRQDLLALVLWGRPQAFVSHRAAASLWNLLETPHPPEICTPRNLRPRTGDIVVHRKYALPPYDRGQVGAFPVTEPTRTLIDLAEVATPQVVELALEAALRARLTSIPRLHWRLERAGKGCRGVASIRSLLDERPIDPRPAESVLELKLARWLKDEGLPEPTRQFEIADKGGFVARVDFCFREAKLVVEADSYKYHSGKLHWEADLERRNRLTASGYTVLNVTHRQIEQKNPLIVEAIRRHLAG